LQRLNAVGLDAEDWGDLSIPPDGQPMTHRPAPARRLRTVERLGEQLAKLIRPAFARGFVPLVLGGDHSLVLGSIAASAQVHDDLGVLWLDAHPDFNTLETSPTGNAHGMGLGLLAGVDSRPPEAGGRSAAIIDPQRIAMVGIRSVDEGEGKLVKAAGIRVWTTADVRRLGALAVARQSLEYLAAQGCRTLHVSVDLDVLDPGLWPGVATPVPDGISAAELVTLVRTAAAEATVVSADIVELDPSRDPHGITTRAGIQVAITALEG
jgi:arginase